MIYTEIIICIKTIEKIFLPVQSGPHMSSPPGITYEQIRMTSASRVAEDTLTEIPLNGSENGILDEKKEFSLSPEATECDSAEVESVISEEGK